jgi:diaminopimelate epimerase
MPLAVIGEKQPLICTFAKIIFYMKAHFWKYHGAGNDFVIFDNRSGEFNTLSILQLRFLCHRHFGIGGDGLMMLQDHPEADFEMKYFNSNGREGSMCGNGGRCIAAFAKRLGIIGDKTNFMAVDGLHEATLITDSWVELKMHDITSIERGYDFAILDTGSPHYVKYTDGLDELDVVSEGKAVRYNERFSKQGINVNFIQYGADALHIRTYERGVEDETMACGTGITAAAIVAAGNQNTSYVIPIKANGGKLEVRYDKKDDQHFENIWLCGPATFSFEGDIEIPK